jgi:predicted MPP superfamily phosphohydrolase
VVAALLAIYAFFIEPARLVVREELLALPDWSSRPLRVALIADIHAGAPFVREEKLRELVNATNRAKPDLVFLLGDYVIQGVIGGRFIEPEVTAAILKNLRAPLGTYAVLGNHDGWLDRERVHRALLANGIHVLRNQQSRVGDIHVAGLADVWTDQPDFTTITKEEEPVIVLTHHPDVFPKIPSFAALTIAGHTHGGQVNLPVIGRPVVPSAFGQRYAAGHVVEGGKHLFVTTGVGTSIIPVRFRVVPEVVVLRLERAR